MSTERDTHFYEFASLHYPELADLFYKMHAAWAMGKEAQARAIVYEIKTLIAQRAYDLGEHVFNHTTEAMTIFDSFEVLAELGEIPDLTEWPKSE